MPAVNPGIFKGVIVKARVFYNMPFFKNFV